MHVASALLLWCCPVPHPIPTHLPCPEYISQHLAHTSNNHMPISQSLIMALVAAGNVGVGFTRRTGLPACLRPPYLDEVTRIELTGARVPPFPSPPTSPTRAPVWQGITVV